MIPISICVIAKNEQKHIENFFKNIQNALGNYPYEIIFVDTGSTDNTVFLASQFVPRVYHFAWIQDFSAAKNYALSIAHNHYILFLDCDEYLTAMDTKCIDLFVTQHPTSLGVININNHLPSDNADRIRSDKVTRFFNKDYYHFEGAVHEQLLPFDSSHKSSHVSLPVTIEHLGYQGTPEELHAKVQRNNSILFDMLNQNPNDPYIYFQLGASYSMIKDYENAYIYYGKGLEFDVDPRLRYVQEMVLGYGYAMLETNRFEEALNFEGIFEEFGNLSDFLTLMGLIYLRNGIIDRGYVMFEKATNAPEYIDEDTRTIIPQKNMAIIESVLNGAT